MEERQFSCDVCSKTFRRKCTFDHHLLLHKEVKKEVSNDGEGESSDNIKFTLKKHEKKIRKKYEKKMFRCKQCKIPFHTKNTLDVHLLIHAGKKPFTCNECHRRFAQKSDLKIHCRVHIKAAKQFYCKTCYKKYTSARKFSKHLLNHTGEKLNTCDICAKQFQNKHRLKIHYRSHTGEKPYECKICKKTFSERRSLVQHGPSHSREQLYTSDESQSQCVSKNTLPKPIYSPTTECSEIKNEDTTELSDFFCNKCEKKFSSQLLADNHLCNPPVKEKFVCEKCNSVFSLLKSLKCHIQYNHNKTRCFVCVACKREFLIKDHLDLHSCPFKS